MTVRVVAARPIRMSAFIFWESTCRFHWPFVRLFTLQSPFDPQFLVRQCADNMSSVTSSIRFLISNAAAGSVIGKGGGTISEFQAKSGARIQLSRNHEYFPGTTDRIILISGTVNEISTALHLILSKIINEVRMLRRKLLIGLRASDSYRYWDKC